MRMSQPFDLSQFPDLLPEVVKAFAAQQKALEHARFEASVERAARQHEQAVVAEKEAFIAELEALIEKLDPAQLELALKDLETAIAETQAQIAEVEEKIAASASDPEKKKPRKTRKARALPESLPRIERVVEPDSIVYPCGCGDMVRIGEDRSERLDYIPARYQVIVTVRLRYACPKGRTGVVQAKTPAHLRRRGVGKPRRYWRGSPCPIIQMPPRATLQGAGETIETLWQPLIRSYGTRRALISAAARSFRWLRNSPSNCESR